MKYPEIQITGDTSVAVVFGDEISEDINTKIRAFDKALNDEQIVGIYETVPTYCALTIHYAPELIRYRELRDKLEAMLSQSHKIQKMNTIVMEIPVLYGGEYGPDLEYVAKHNNMPPEEVIRRHCEAEYLIYMLGFTPGFTYLGGMSDSIATPRLTTPRVKIPAGSVGIAGTQTGVYPIDSPGGWQLIGRTPVRMYDPDRETPILPEAGQYIKFYAIDKAEYDKIASEEAAGTYVCKRHPREEGAK